MRYVLKRSACLDWQWTCVGGIVIDQPSINAFQSHNPLSFLTSSSLQPALCVSNEDRVAYWGYSQGCRVLYMSIRIRSLIGISRTRIRWSILDMQDNQKWIFVDSRWNEVSTTCLGRSSCAITYHFVCGTVSISRPWNVSYALLVLRLPIGSADLWTQSTQHYPYRAASCPPWIMRHISSWSGLQALSYNGCKCLLHPYDAPHISILQDLKSNVC